VQILSASIPAIHDLPDAYLNPDYPQPAQAHEDEQ
jgi:hypothetical protein